MCRSDDPSLGHQGAATGYPLREERLLDDGSLPWVVPELGVSAANDTVAPRVGLALLYGAKGQGVRRSQAQRADWKTRYGGRRAFMVGSHQVGLVA